MPRNILIVDDQEDILLILEREFRRRPGLAVVGASKSDDALRILSEKRIDLVIADVRLGMESGFDLVREINRSYPGMGSILMSAYRSSSNRQQAADLGVVLFLEKPFQVAKLIEEVEKYFNKLDHPEPEAVAAAAAAPAPTDSSGLAHFKPQDLIQLFCLNGRSIRLTVTSGASAGEIYIQRARVVHAEFNEKSGEDAYFSILQLPEPQLKVDDWNEPTPLTIKTGWEHLLLQAAVQFDHQA